MRGAGVSGCGKRESGWGSRGEAGEVAAGLEDVHDARIAIGMMNRRIDDTARVLAVAIKEFHSAQAHLHREVADGGAMVARAERRLTRALQGMTLARWQALVSGKASIRSARDSRDAHLAKKRRLAVDAALGEVRAARDSHALRVAEAEGALEEAARRLQRFGPLAVRLSVLPAVSSSRLELRDAPASMST